MRISDWSSDVCSSDLDDLSITIFSESQQLPFDSTGRIQLPEALRAHAGIADKAAFVGMGTLFQIWEPGRLAAHKAAARQSAREQIGRASCRERVCQYG